MKTLFSIFTVAISLLGGPFTTSAHAESLSRNDLWACVVFKECPKGLTPNRARTGLDKDDQTAADRSIKLREQMTKDGLIECASGGKCPPDISPARADEIIEEALDEPSSKEDMERARRCYIYGDCRKDLVSGDVKRTLPKFEQQKLETEKTRQIERNKIAFAAEVRKCANLGQCKRPLTPDNARKFDQLGGLGQALQRCAAGYGCPEGINQSQAMALTDSDYDRWKNETEKAKAVEPEESDLRFDEDEGTPLESDENGSPAVTDPQKDLTFEETETGRKANDEDLIFEDPELDRLLAEKREKPGRSPLSPITASNPNVGIAAYVTAAAGPQQTPHFFTPQELLSKRLPWLDGGDEPDETIAQQDPSLEKPGTPRPITDATVETIASPLKAPSVFRIERSNNHQDRSDTEQVRTTLTGRIDSNGPVPRISFEAEIVTEQVSTEKYGAKLITGGPPTGEVDAMAFLPIDDGGTAINVSLAIAASLPHRSMRAGVVPYTEDPFANLSLVGQTRTFLSAQNPQQALSSAQFIYGLAGYEPPSTGSFADFVEFNFPETSPGKPRGFLVFLSGEADSEIVSKTDTVRGLDRVTVITAKGTQTGKISVLVETAWAAQR